MQKSGAVGTLAGRSTAVDLVNFLQQRAEEFPEQPLYTLLTDGESPADPWTFADLERKARALGAALAERGLAGERALLLYPAGLDFIAAFWGCLFAGMVAVPAYPLRPGQGPARLARLAADARPKVVLAPASLVGKQRQPTAGIEALSDVPWLATDELLRDQEDELAAAWQPPELSPDHLAFLQYTSGSTSAPKGVMVTHGNLLHNQEMIRRAFGQSEDSVVVSWLPLYHDMGLIGGVLQPLYTGGRCILMSPTAFLKRPARWLEAIHRFRATTSGGPDFAYDLCVRKVSEEEARGLDLSCWEVAFDGAEPVRAETLDRFAERFAPQGFRRRSFVPCYGLAEATLLVSAASPGEGPRTGAFAAQSLARDRAVAVEEDDPNARCLVSCGSPGEGLEVRVVDPESRRSLEPGRIGEIWVAGASVTRGYWDRPEESARSFEARRADAPSAGPYLRTGDLGFLTHGEVVIAGRLKDLVVLRGLNHHPHDLERTAEAAHPELVTGGGAAFSVEGKNGEELVLVLEVGRRRELDSERTERIAEAVRRELAREHAVAVADVVFLGRGRLPRTSSGKVRRRACRDLYEAGELPALGRSAEAAEAQVGDAAVSSRALSREEIEALPPQERGEALLELLRHEVARLARIPVDRVETGRPPTELGLDSLGAAELARSLDEQGLGSSLSMTEVLDGVSLEALVETVLGRAEPVEEGPRGPVPTGRETGLFPLSPGQRALWFLHRLAPESAAYHLAGAVRVEGELDARALAAAVGDLVHRHSVLRTTFVEERDRPLQQVSAESPVRLEQIEPPETSARWIETPFDLEAGPLFRLGLLRQPDGETRLLFVLHHLIADFASIGVLLRDLGVLYARRRGLAAPELPTLSLTYGDFALWQDERLAEPDGEIERLAADWRDRWNPAPPTLELPTDRPRPPVRRFRGASHGLRLDASRAAALRALARDAETTPFTVLLAALFAVLHRWSGQDDLVVGAPTAGRDVPGPLGVGDLVGYFVNPIPLRVPVDHHISFADFLHGVRQTSLETFAHRGLPFAHLAEILAPERDLSRSPLFDVLIAFETSRAGDLDEEAAGLGALALGQAGPPMPFADVELEPVPLLPEGAPFDLTLVAADVGDELGLTLRYDADLFDQTTAVRFAGHLETLLAAVCRDPEATLSRLALMEPGERHQVTREAPVATEPGPLPAGLHAPFFSRAEETPDRIALVAERAETGLEQHLSYETLAIRSRELAFRLVQLGVAAETPVALALPREPDLVVAILAVLAAGGAYVPLDPSYPRARLEAILEDSGAPILVTRTDLAREWPEVARRPDLRQVLLDAENLNGAVDEASLSTPAAVDPEGLAYLIYTSGSTGRPKGVAIRHGAAAALAAWARDAYSPRELSAVLAATSVSFDLSVFELFAPLSTGGTVVLVRDVLALAEMPGRERVALVNTVPSVLNELLALGSWPASVTTVNLAGEPLRRSLVEDMVATGTVRRVLNLYGPSEDTTYSTGALVLEGSGEPAIGRALPGGRAWVLGPELEPQPLGVTGEIVLGGAGLARGYLGRPAATAEHFVPDPWTPSPEAPGGRLYRTGDLGRLRPDGGLEFLGRFDHQVKVRGFRIELGEIESVLARHPDVREVAVLAGALVDGGWQSAISGPRSALAACVVPISDGVDPEGLPRELAEYLAARLPRYMVPGVWSLHEALPRTPSGKVDRRTLATRVRPVTTPGDASGTERLSPRSPVAEILAGIWQEVLGVVSVEDEDDFFRLGGHSLLATQVVSRVRRSLGVELPVGQLFETPTLEALAKVVQGLRTAGSEVGAPIRRISREQPLALSFAQERLWFLEQLEPGSAFYNIPAAVELRGPLSGGVLGEVLWSLTQRHEALRTTFGEASGKPYQKISPEPLAEGLLRTVDLTGLAPEVRAVALDRAATAEARRPYDLSAGPLIRAVLLRLDETEYALLLNLHHIVSDGWSNAVLLTEMRHLYEAFFRGEPSPLEPLEVQYVDYVAWQREQLAGDVLGTQLDYWREHLAGVSGLELSTDRPRPPVETFRGGNLSFVLSAAQSDRLQALARRRGATLFAVLLAAWKTLMLRVTGQSDVPVGSPIANRTRAEIEGVVGFFVNTLVLRAPLGDNPKFEELVDRVQRVALDAYVHQDLPFERLVEELAPERDMSRNPLFQVMCVLQNQPWPEAGLGDARLAPLYLDTGTAKFDLTLFWQDWDGRLHGLFEYNSDLFDRTTARRLARHQQALLEAVVAEPTQSLWELPLFSRVERHQLLAEWNDTRVADRDDPAGPGLVHRRVEAQVDRTPDAVAAVFGDHHSSYRELETRANRLAHRLRARGVAPEGLVGICLERSLEMGVALLAVLKAGGAAVALDPAYPQERLSFIVREARLQVLLTEGRRAQLFPDHEEIQLRLDVPDPAGDEEPGTRSDIGVEPDHPIYAIYTSGSTGRPKGILVPHGAFANLLDWQLGADGDPTGAPLARGARTLQNSTFGFCVSFQEVFASWASGATLVVPDEMTRRDVAGLLEVLEREAIERLHLPFSALKHLAEAAVGRERLPAPLRDVITAGEQLQVTPAVAALLEGLSAGLPEGCSLHNQYGASETHVVSALTLTGSPGGWPAIPSIGRPVTDTRIHLLDRELAPVPIGVAGELYAAGPCVPRGYLADPRLTAAKVVPDPWGPAGSRMYRTGDSARHLANGEIEYHGRIDTQVKIRGFRVELGEVDTVLASHEGVRDVATQARRPSGGEPRLVAYVVPTQHTGDDLFAELSDLARRKLPDYMVPAAFVEMERLPVNVNGKLDASALPEPELERPGDRPRIAPRTPTEEALAGIWAKVLSRPVETLSVEDDFFELGGHSLLATQVTAEIRATLGLELPLKRLFENPTLEVLARVVSESGREDDGARERIPRQPRDTDRFPVSFSQLREWILDRFEPGASAYNIAVPLCLEGRLDVVGLHQALRHVVERHESLRTRFLATAGEPLQVVSSQVPLPMPRVDMSGLPESSTEPVARRLARREGERSFDLTRGPLFRARLLRLAPEDHWLLLTFHHSIADGWSMGVVSRELAAFYRGQLDGVPAQVPELPFQYPDFAVWQRERMTGETLESLASYWREQLAGSTGELDLPTDRPRPPVRSDAGDVVAVGWKPELAERLRRLARDRGASLFMVVLAGFDALFHRYTGQDDLSVGTFIANRNRAETRDLVGFFINTLTLRVDVSGDPTFGELVDRAREVTLGAYAHQDLPFEKLLELLQVPRDRSRTPLFQAMLVLQNLPIGRLELPGVAMERVDIERRHSDFDLTLWLWETGGGLTGHLDFATTLFDRTAMIRLLHHLEGLLEAVVAEDGQQARLSELPLLPAAERHQLLVEWNDAPGPVPDEIPAHLRFRRQARATPDAVAVVAGQTHVSYRALETWASRWAERLRARGVGVDTVVAVATERTVPVLAAFLAVLEAGGAYLPLDPSHPPERLAFQLDDARARLLLGSRENLDRMVEAARQVEIPTLVLSDSGDPDHLGDASRAEPASVEPPLDALAYVLYTSGSTGEPKGVGVTHRGLGSYVGMGAAGCPLGPRDRALQFAALTFDTAAEEIYPCLAAGATLVLRPEGTLTPEDLLGLTASEQITVLNFPTSYWHRLVPRLETTEVPPSVRLTIIGGEAASSEAVAAWHHRVDRPRSRLVNGYGPTEATVIVTATDLDGRSGAPIGRSLADSRVVLLDRHGEPIPLGARGEIHAAGAGLARGYVGRPGTTARAFVPDAVSSSLQGEPGGRLYATGDVARHLPDGRLDFLGRRDEQVKVRGYRIEPGEVENALADHPGIAEAVVEARRDDATEPLRLVAWVVRKKSRESAEEPGVAELRGHLGERLPSYMVPAAFVFLDALPLTRHGKVDRRALPEPIGDRPDLEAGYAPPTDALERRIAAVWQEVLGLDRVGIHDNFFELGGDSLAILRIHQRLVDDTGQQIPVLELFRYPTLHSLAERLREDAGGADARTVEAARERVRETRRAVSERRERLRKRRKRDRK